MKPVKGLRYVVGGRATTPAYFPAEIMLANSR